MAYQISISLPKELELKVKEQASEEERTVSNMITYIVKQYYKNKAE